MKDVIKSLIKGAVIITAIVAGSILLDEIILINILF